MKTASAIILAGAVAILPSDHYVDDDAAFMARVEGAIEAVAARSCWVPGHGRSIASAGVLGEAFCGNGPNAYARLEPTDFSRDVLERCPERLAVLSVTGTGDHSIPLRSPASGDPEDRTRAAASAS